VQQHLQLVLPEKYSASGSWDQPEKNFFIRVREADGKKRDLFKMSVDIETSMSMYIHSFVAFVYAIGVANFFLTLLKAQKRFQCFD
jgi:hypothetical protein